MTAQALADTLNRNRALRGDPPVNARVVNGCIVMDPQFRAPPRPVAPPPERQINKAETRARKAILRALTDAPRPMTITEIAATAGRTGESMRTYLYRMESDGTVIRGRPRLAPGARKPSATFKLAEGALL
jgi:hypothetical protein